MALASRAHRSAPKGRAKPRIAPPIPARSDLAGFRETAASIGIVPMPWQETSARYTEALGPDGRHLFGEVCEVVARQNGKTEKLVILFVKRLRAGRRIMYTAQDRDEPREVFARVADIIGQDETLFPMRNGRHLRPRFSNGQEEITLANGGRLKIVAPTRSGARGKTNDDVVIDELREMVTWDFIGAAKPTMAASPDPQIIYLTSEGDDSSIVLNSIKSRAESDPRLAFLSWSMPPDLASDDRDGWLYANPAIGHIPTMMGYLEEQYLSHKLGGTLNLFEVEHLCRAQPTMRDRLIDDQAWAACAGDVGKPSRPVLGVSMDPDRQRASVVMAWQDAQGRTCLTQLVEDAGSPIDTDALGQDVREIVTKHGVRRVAYDPLTDAELAKYLRKAEPVTGRAFAVASSTFTEQVASKRLVWADADQVTADLLWTAKKEHDETGTFQAVRAKDDRPITASLAAIRAVGLVFGPRPAPPRMY